MRAHKNICRYVDSFIATKDGYKLYLVMEYCDQGDFAQFLIRKKAMREAVSLGCMNRDPSKAKAKQ